MTKILVSFSKIYKFSSIYLAFACDILIEECLLIVLQLVCLLLLGTDAKVARNFRKLKKVLNFGVENRQRKRKELDNQYQALNFESALIVGPWTRSGKEKAPTNFLIDAYLESALIVGPWTRGGNKQKSSKLMLEALC